MSLLSKNKSLHLSKTTIINVITINFFSPPSMEAIVGGGTTIGPRREDKIFNSKLCRGIPFNAAALLEG